MNSKQRLELTWIGKENRPKLEPRILLEDPGAVEDEVADIWWQLYLIDENDEPIEPITSLLESLLATDPTGREMGPPQPSGPSN